MGHEVANYIFELERARRPSCSRRGVHATHLQLHLPRPLLLLPLSHRRTSFGRTRQTLGEAARQVHRAGPRRHPPPFTTSPLPTDTQDQKLRKIYAAVMKLENTNFTREHSSEEEKSQGFKEVRTTDDIWTRKRGNDDQITELFVAMARAAGMKAYLAAVTSRDRSLFSGLSQPLAARRRHRHRQRRRQRAVLRPRLPILPLPASGLEAQSDRGHPTDRRRSRHRSDSRQSPTPTRALSE